MGIPFLAESSMKVDGRLDERGGRLAKVFWDQQDFGQDTTVTCSQLDQNRSSAERQGTEHSHEGGNARIHDE